VDSESVDHHARIRRSQCSHVPRDLPYLPFRSLYLSNLPYNYYSSEVYHFGDIYSLLILWYWSVTCLRKLLRAEPRWKPTSAGEAKRWWRISSIMYQLERRSRSFPSSISPDGLRPRAHATGACPPYGPVARSLRAAERMKKCGLLSEQAPMVPFCLARKTATVWRLYLLDNVWHLVYLSRKASLIQGIYPAFQRYSYLDLLWSLRYSLQSKRSPNKQYNSVRGWPIVCGVILWSVLQHPVLTSRLSLSELNTRCDNVLRMTTFTGQNMATIAIMTPFIGTSCPRWSGGIETRSTIPPSAYIGMPMDAACQSCRERKSEIRLRGSLIHFIFSPLVRSVGARTYSKYW